LGLGAFVLSDKEWVLAKQLCEVLKILKHATQFFSCRMPNLAVVIPAMDHIDNVFTTGIIKTDNLDPAICAALHIAKKTLNRYYPLTDRSETYRIAMVLHPCYKLEYFKAID
ncbi:hypothetical protein DFJ58DRAFT_670031, partial [Suillus subalutaceus]|uniref:uncharacterized protein n=1 Tax=Suillus subalutaceus TaxID=48586 RepID=UPI001B86A3C8